MAVFDVPVLRCAGVKPNGRICGEPIGRFDLVAGSRGEIRCSSCKSLVVLAALPNGGGTILQVSTRASK